MSAHAVMVFQEFENSFWPYCECEWQGSDWARRDLAVIEAAGHLLAPEPSQ